MRPRNERREASQKQRLLAWARAGRPLHQQDWFNGGPDGRSPITAVRSRVSDLERAGFGFHHLTRPDATVEYRLADAPTGAGSIEPGRVAPGVDDELLAELAAGLADRTLVVVGEQPRLFDPPPLEAAMHDWEDVELEDDED